MDSKTTFSITEGRRKFFEIAEEVQKPGIYYTLTENGKPKVVIISYSEFESLIETLEVMEEMPDLAKDIKEVDRAVEAGDHKNWTTLEELFAKQGYVLAEKAKKPYGIHSPRRAKSRKAVK